MGLEKALKVLPRMSHVEGAVCDEKLREEREREKKRERTDRESLWAVEGCQDAVTGRQELSVH